jgi:hypothetical protein
MIVFLLVIAACVFAFPLVILAIVLGGAGVAVMPFVGAAKPVKMTLKEQEEVKSFMWCMIIVMAWMSWLSFTGEMPDSDGPSPVAGWICAALSAMYFICMRVMVSQGERLRKEYKERMKVVRAHRKTRAKAYDARMKKARLVEEADRQVPLPPGCPPLRPGDLDQAWQGQEYQL